MSSLPILPSIGESLKKNEKEIIQTVLTCIKCKANKTRDFIPGDVVFKEVDGEKCEKCSGKLIITQIYSEVIKK
ncbi:MAG: hypothetical protein ACTSVI_05710 [Promethearchaeota archaeon]